MLRVITVLIFGVLLAGCGFHLRGTGGIQDTGNIPATYLQADTSAGGIGRELSRLDKFTSDAGKAEAALQVISEGFDRRVLSVGRRGKVNEYEILYTVRFTVSDKAGKELLAPTTINLTRDYQFDETQVLAKDSEEAVLRRDLVRDAAQQIVRRLQALNK